MILPPNAAFQTIVGPVSQNSHLAKQLVCLEACKKLHQMGALDDHLLPYIELSSEQDISVKSKESASGAGMCVSKLLTNYFLVVRYIGHKDSVIPWFQGYPRVVYILGKHAFVFESSQTRMHREQ